MGSRGNAGMAATDSHFPVLILDDDQATVALQKRILERAGFRVVATSTVAEARASVERDRVALLILDYRLGSHASGLDFFRSLTAEGFSLPAILVTSFSDESKVIEALRAGIRDVVPKSGDYLEYLPLAVSRIIEQVRTARRVAESEANARLVEALQASEESLKRIAEERERLLESERAARAESERAGRLKDEFLATLSHELRTPLNAILGWAHLLRARPYDPLQTAEGLETIDRNARAQTRIVDDLLEMSRIISGKLRLNVERVDILTIIDAAISGIRPAAEAKGIRLTTNLDVSAGPISGDPARLQQILWNLLSNAVKFTPENGEVRVVLERVPPQIQLTISDTGEGIKPEFLPYLFDRFRQADASTTRQHRGMGLGLSIVKNLVEMHGGVVTASSDGEGRGSTFVVKLPCTVTSDATADDPLEEALHGTLGAEMAPQLNDLRVLVVDDEPDAREFLARLLTESGAKVETASSVGEALLAVEKGPPDVLISDIGMPQADGYELIRAVRALPAARGGQMPALALTAFARSEDRQRALLAGYQAHLAKPIHPTELITQIASLAGRLWPVRRTPAGS
jgi:signal transduction histidine kinase